MKITVVGAGNVRLQAARLVVPTDLESLGLRHGVYSILTRAVGSTLIRWL